MRQRLLIAALILVSSSLLGVETAQATALGLADGTYDITFDFTNDANNGTGTITIGGSVVTSFHFANPVGQWDCGSPDCADDGFAKPDRVIFNNTIDFRIDDQTAPLNSKHFLDISAFNTAFIDLGGGSRDSGTWSATPAPEPLSSTLMLIGLGALGLRRWLRAKQD